MHGGGAPLPHITSHTMKALFTAACVITCCLGNEMPAQARHATTRTTVQDQVRVCKHIPARPAGYIKVAGKPTVYLTNPAEVKCTWEPAATRTVINTFRTY